METEQSPRQQKTLIGKLFEILINKFNPQFPQSFYHLVELHLNPRSSQDLIIATQIKSQHKFYFAFCFISKLKRTFLETWEREREKKKSTERKVFCFPLKTFISFFFKILNIFDSGAFSWRILRKEFAIVEIARGRANKKTRKKNLERWWRSMTLRFPLQAPRKGARTIHSVFLCIKWA